MNISSVVINVKNGGVIEDIKARIADVEGCEIITNDENRIIVVVGVESFDDELKTFHTLEKIDGVANVTMVYSYQEDLDLDLEKLKDKVEISEILTNDNIQAQDIVYQGHIGDRAK